MIIFKGKLKTQTKVAAMLAGTAIKDCVHYADKFLELYCDPGICKGSNANCWKVWLVPMANQSKPIVKFWEVQEIERFHTSEFWKDAKYY